MAEWRARSVLALLCAAVLAAHAHHKRQDLSPAPFTFAARYGRSPDRLIAPRNNRWLLTSRYGKRSQSFPMDSPTPEAPLTLREGPLAPREGPRSVEGPHGVGEGQGVSRALSCVYTGVLAFYRCTHATSLAARRSDVMVPSEEE